MSVDYIIHSTSRIELDVLVWTVKTQVAFIMFGVIKSQKTKQRKVIRVQLCRRCHVAHRFTFKGSK